MTCAYHLTRIADHDLIGIWKNTHERWGARQADQYLKELESCFIELTGHPELGKKRNE